MAIIGPVQWYQPSERLSEDVLGTLWMGRDRRSGSTVTIRLLDERLTSDPRAVHRATVQLRWAQWEAGNRHLARVLDLRLGLAGQPAFVVSEGSSGGTLMQHLMRGQAFTVRRAIEVVAAVADGLASAHASWVYHGALTPASILLDDDVVAKVTDIGLQELLDGPDDHGPSGRASSLNDRAATDVLAVARVFEQLLSSKPGREAGVGSDLTRAWESEMSAELGDLIRRALSPHRLQRPAMAELAAALVPALQAPDGPLRIPPTERARPERVEPGRPTQAPRPEPVGRPRADAPIPLALPRVPTGDVPPRPPQGPGPEPVEASSDDDIGGVVTRQAPAEPIAGWPPVAPVEKPAEPAPHVRRARAHSPRLRFALGVCIVLGVLVGGIFAIRAIDAEVQPQGPATVTATPTTSVTPQPQPATVPVLLGQRVEIATELLEQAGLLVGSVTAVSGETGLVVRTEPTQGEAVIAGTAVDLFVGNGEEG